MEGAGGDRRLGLLDEQGPRRIETIEPGDGARRLFMLARGEFSPAHAVDEDLDARRVVAGAEAHMIGRALVAEGGGHRLMDREMGRVGEGEPELGQRLRPFVAAMRHGPQIGDGQVAAAVLRVRRGGDRRGIGRPHRRGRQSGGAQDLGGILDAGAERAQPAAVRALVRREDPLRQAEPHIVPHLLDALKRRGARKSDAAGIGRGGEIAEAEPGIIVARPDHAVEIDLDERHGG